MISRIAGYLARLRAAVFTRAPGSPTAAWFNIEPKSTLAGLCICR
jgi:hypothetical protein